MVEHHTGIAEFTGSNPIEALIFSGFCFPIPHIGKLTAMIILHFHIILLLVVVFIWKLPTPRKQSYLTVSCLILISKVVNVRFLWMSGTNGWTWHSRNKGNGRIDGKSSLKQPVITYNGCNCEIITYDVLLLNREIRDQGDREGQR